MSELKIPLKVVKAKNTNPKLLLLYGRPKIGKTSILAGLDKCLILQFDKRGGDHIDGLKIAPKNFNDLMSIGKQIYEYKKEHGERPYNYVAIDTITSLEAMAIAVGEKMYSETSMGADWFTNPKKKAKLKTITNMPNGAGYAWLREGYDKIISAVELMAEHVIIMGHVKDTSIRGDDGFEVKSSEINIVGKMKEILCKDSDAIGYIYRNEESEGVISFSSGEDILTGARSEHLRNKQVVISKMDEKTGKLETYWDRIYK